jgi:hypothetical protein
LCSDLEPDARRCSNDHALKGEFGRLFEQLKKLGDGIVEIEVRHSIPFRLLVIRSREEILA